MGRRTGAGHEHLAALGEWVAARDARISSMAAELEERREAVAALEEDLGDRESRLAALQGLLDLQEERLRALVRAVDDRDRRIDAMLESTSWKISAPLRAIASHARKLRLAGVDRGNAVRAVARHVYRRLPLSPGLKLRLRSRAFRHFGSLLGRTAHGRAFVQQGMHPATATPVGVGVQRILGYLNDPAIADVDQRWRYSRFMHHVWWSRLDLQRVFDLREESGREAFAKWYVLSARHEYHLTESAYPDYLLRELARCGDSAVERAAAELLAARERAAESPVAGDATAGAPACALPHPALGANLVGYARGEFGMGEHVRMVARACAATETPFVVLDFEEGGFHGKGDNSVSHWISDQQKYGTNVFHINADAFPALFFHFTPGFFDDHVNVGYWAWELANCPEEFDLALNMVDEVWAISDFVREAFAQRSRVPVVSMPLAVSVPALERRYSKRDFGLPEDAFAFLFTFDAASYLDRKNPIGAVKAFKWAFPGERGARQGSCRLIHAASCPVS